MRTTAVVFVALIAIVSGAALAPSAAADAGTCVPTPPTFGIKALLDYVTFLLFFWDPNLEDCVA